MIAEHHQVTRTRAAPHLSDLIGPRSGISESLQESAMALQPPVAIDSEAWCAGETLLEAVERVLVPVDPRPQRGEQLHGIPPLVLDPLNASSLECLGCLDLPSPADP